MNNYNRRNTDTFKNVNDWMQHNENNELIICEYCETPYHGKYIKEFGKNFCMDVCQELFTQQCDNINKHLDTILRKNFN